MAQPSFEIKELELLGVLLITPRIFTDDRGFFAETFRDEVFKERGITDAFVQDNISFSKKNVVRGLHAQKEPFAQAKLVRCVSGEVFDVAADVDPASPTYGKWVSATLSGETQAMLYVPGNYVHGLCVISEDARVEYKVNNYYHPESAFGIRYNDPTVGIAWPVSNPILSAQDRALPLL